MNEIPNFVFVLSTQQIIPVTHRKEKYATEITFLLPFKASKDEWVQQDKISQLVCLKVKQFL